MRVLGSIFALLLSACTTGALGADCASSEDCEDILVCGASEGAPYCTRRCQPGEGASCPEDWVCTPRRGDANRGLCLRP